ncbi:MAG TPA: hypothetical protein VGR27_03645 [Longimicrobiaceae bacterium]|nr:hypothetical protein [Longimicrobiaceae bacterium]
MSKHTAESGLAQAHIELRRARVIAVVERPLHPPACEPLQPSHLAYLLREAKDLYWNEMAWEQLTDEEVISGGRFTELVFPALLAFIDGLLLEDSATDAAARPHPDAVEAILTFLGERYAACSAQLEAGADSQRLVWERLMTAHLIDLVLCRLYRLSPAEREEVEAGA